jgi:hypothetical protein
MYEHATNDYGCGERIYDGCGARDSGSGYDGGWELKPVIMIIVV